jgi:putative phosphoribosyl transferase
VRLPAALRLLKRPGSGRCMLEAKAAAPGTPLMLTFRNRTEAGQLLGRHLQAMQLHDPVVLALPRGGVPVAAEVARALHAPLDLLLVRKIGAPHQPELAVAAVAEDCVLVTDEQSMAWSGATDAYIARQAELQRAEIARRRQLYLAGRAPEPLGGRCAVVVDDGIATGSTARAALQALRRRGPARVVLAVAVAAPESLAALAPLVDEVVCLSQPPSFRAVGAHYENFEQVADEEVARLMSAHPAGEARRPLAGA